MSAAIDARVVRPLARPDAASTLVCLAFCGGGTSGYRAFADHLGPEVDLAIVCYPGREGRFAEEFARDWHELAADATAAVTAAVMSAPTSRYRLFGHSMGGWMAFDVTVRLEQAGGPVPEELVVSSCNAADRGVTDRDRFPRGEDSDAVLLEWMQVSGSLPDYVLGDPDLREMAVELMRADVAVRDSYRPTPGARTAVPVHVLHGVDDPVIEPEVAVQWSALAAAPVRCTRLPGGHFYTEPVWNSLPDHFLPVSGALIPPPSTDRRRPS